MLHCKSFRIEDAELGCAQTDWSDTRVLLRALARRCCPLVYSVQSRSCNTSWPLCAKRRASEWGQLLG
jgi:hypothetical protein